MKTPEGRVKDKVRKVLSAYPSMWKHWPVSMGMGRKTVDFLGCYRGRFFAIETKAPGKKPTLLQTAELQRVGEAMGKTFVISSTDDPELVRLTAWLDNLTETIDDNPTSTTRRRP